MMWAISILKSHPANKRTNHDRITPLPFCNHNEEMNLYNNYYFKALQKKNNIICFLKHMISPIKYSWLSLPPEKSYLSFIKTLYLYTEHIRNRGNNLCHHIDAIRNTRLWVVLQDKWPRKLSIKLWSTYPRA